MIEDWDAVRRDFERDIYKHNPPGDSMTTTPQQEQGATPRTDAAIAEIWTESADLIECVDVETCRQLERELLAAQSRLEAVLAALQELVDLKDLKDALGTIFAQEGLTVDATKGYAERKPKAWEAARKALAPPAASKGEEG